MDHSYTSVLISPLKVLAEQVPGTVLVRTAGFCEGVKLSEQEGFTRYNECGGCQELLNRPKRRLKESSQLLFPHSKH